MMRASVASVVLALFTSSMSAVAQEPPIRPASNNTEIEVVSGKRLPVVSVEPVVDGVFIVRATAPLAEKYRSVLLSKTLSDFERKHLADAARIVVDENTAPSKVLPRYLVRVKKDDRGRLFLYDGCDAGARYFVARDWLIMLGGEPWALRITNTKEQQGTVALTLDVDGLPPFLPSTVTFQRERQAGVFETGGELMMTFDEAAKLDIVVNRCTKAKTKELSFESPSHK